MSYLWGLNRCCCPIYVTHELRRKSDGGIFYQLDHGVGLTSVTADVNSFWAVGGGPSENFRPWNVRSYGYGNDVKRFRYNAAVSSVKVTAGGGGNLLVSRGLHNGATHILLNSSGHVVWRKKIVGTSAVYYDGSGYWIPGILDSETTYKIRKFDEDGNELISRVFAFPTGPTTYIPNTVGISQLKVVGDSLYILLNADSPFGGFPSGHIQRWTKKPGEDVYITAFPSHPTWDYVDSVTAWSYGSSAGDYGAPSCFDMDDNYIYVGNLTNNVSTTARVRKFDLLGNQIFGAWPWRSHRTNVYSVVVSQGILYVAGSANTTSLGQVDGFHETLHAIDTDTTATIWSKSRVTGDGLAFGDFGSVQSLAIHSVADDQYLMTAGSRVHGLRIISDYLI